MRTTRPPFRTILVPHDFSACGDQALRVASDLAETHGGTMILLHVVTPFHSGPGHPTREEIARTPDEIAETRRWRLAARARTRLGSARARRVCCRTSVGEALPAILAAAEDADVIVMATLGRTGLARVLLGSVAEQVVRHAPVPVLTVRPAAAARRRRKARVAAR